jgi:hypothetical protein
VLSLRQVRLCFGKLVQCTPAALQQQFAFVGEVHAAGGALEQARAEVLFEAGDALADRRRDRPSTRAAPTMLPASAVRTKASRAEMESMPG